MTFDYTCHRNENLCGVKVKPKNLFVSTWLIFTQMNGERLSMGQTNTPWLVSGAKRFSSGRDSITRTFTAARANKQSWIYRTGNHAGVVGYSPVCEARALRPTESSAIFDPSACRSLATNSREINVNINFRKVIFFFVCFARRGLAKTVAVSKVVGETWLTSTKSSRVRIIVLHIVKEINPRGKCICTNLCNASCVFHHPYDEMMCLLSLSERFEQEWLWSRNYIDFRFVCC